jgi:hypothetical protein
VSRPVPACRTLTDARLDRIADLSRDLGAMATALHYDVGVPADAAIDHARKTFRRGETVRQWWGRAVASPGDPPQEVPMSDLYNDDILLWSERQAELQHAARHVALAANDLLDLDVGLGRRGRGWRSRWYVAGCRQWLGRCGDLRRRHLADCPMTPRRGGDRAN